MKITAITRYKHGNLYEALKKLGWTQSDLAERAGLSAGTIGHIINLIRRPNEEQANAIQRAFGEAGVYMDVMQEWPETFRGLMPGYKREQSADVPMESLLDHPEVLRLEAPAPDIDIDATETIVGVLSELSPQQQLVIKERYFRGKTYQEIGDQIGICKMMVRNYEQQALRRLRNTRRIRVLEQLTEFSLSGKTIDDEDFVIA